MVPCKCMHVCLCEVLCFLNLRLSVKTESKRAKEFSLTMINWEDMKGERHRDG